MPRSVLVMTRNVPAVMFVIGYVTGEVSMTWTGCETIEDEHSDFYGSATGLLLVLRVSDRHSPYTVRMAISHVPVNAIKELEFRMFSPYLGRESSFKLIRV